jgi:hypothetical protein
VDPSHALAYLRHPISITQHPRNEHNWNALDDGGDVTPVEVVESLPILARIFYLEMVAVLLHSPNFTVITSRQYLWPNKLTTSGIDEHWGGR